MTQIELLVSYYLGYFPFISCLAIVLYFSQRCYTTQVAEEAFALFRSEVAYFGNTLISYYGRSGDSTSTTFGRRA